MNQKEENTHFLEKARKVILEAIEINRRFDDKILLPHSLISYSNLLASEGKIEESMEIDEETIEISKETGDFEIYVHTSNNLVDRLMTSGNYEKAMRILSEVDPLTKKTSLELASFTKENFGELHDLLSTHYFEESEKIIENNNIGSHKIIKVARSSRKIIFEKRLRQIIKALPRGRIEEILNESVDN